MGLFVVEYNHPSLFPRPSRHGGSFVSCLVREEWWSGRAAARPTTNLAPPGEMCQGLAIHGFVRSPRVFVEFPRAITNLSRVLERTRRSVSTTRALHIARVSSSLVEETVLASVGSSARDSVDFPRDRPQPRLFLSVRTCARGKRSLFWLSVERESYVIGARTRTPASSSNYFYQVAGCSSGSPDDALQNAVHFEATDCRGSSTPKH